MSTDCVLADDDCYRALSGRNARFDGSFYTGVTSTGIYCRPVCSVKTPRRENCHFFRHAAQAESAGFRPCLRCRPELAPHSVVWSIQNASYILAHQAVRLLDECDAWLDHTRSLALTGCGFLPPEGAALARGGPPLHAPSIKKLAERLGVSSRHMRRIFETQLGVSPMQYLQTRRLHVAKQLLADTELPITQIALMSGYASVRRFNAEFVAHYKLNPTQLRRKGGYMGANVGTEAGTTIRLGYRPPYDVAAMLTFFAKHQMHTIECLEGLSGSTASQVMSRTFAVEAAGKTYSGWLRMRFDEDKSQLILNVSDSLVEVLPLVIRRTRDMFDLDADPATISSVLHTDFPTGDGLRVPGSVDGYELAVRAVLGQQITVAAARTLSQRIADRFGEEIKTPWPGLSRLFPAPSVLAAASSDALGQLGIVRQRQAAIIGIAQAVANKQLQLHPGADVQATLAQLKALPGIGDWTAQYIAMRALRWPDAFPAGDVALQKSLGVQKQKLPAKLAEAASTGWKPWRSYAVIRVWSGAWAGGQNATVAQGPCGAKPDTIKRVATDPHKTCTTALKDSKSKPQATDKSGTAL